MVAKPIALDFTRDLSPAIKKNDWVYNNNNLIFNISKTIDPKLTKSK